MPVYRYTHDCGYKGDQFLKADKDAVVLPCARCNRNVTARQVRTKGAMITEKDEVRGVFQHDNGGDNANRR